MTNADKDPDAVPSDTPLPLAESRRVSQPFPAVKDWRIPLGDPDEQAEAAKPRRFELPERREVIWHTADGVSTEPPAARARMADPEAARPEFVRTANDTSAHSPSAANVDLAESQAGPAVPDAPETEEIPAVSLASFAESAAASARGEAGKVSPRELDLKETDESADEVFPPPLPTRGAHGRERYRNTRRILIIGTAIVLAAVGGLAARLTFPSEPSSAAGTNNTVVLPSPTPTVMPIQREDGTEFFSVLPSTVNDFALTSYVPVDIALDPELGNPLEAYAVTYTNGNDLILLYAAQWATEDEVQAALPALEEKLSPGGTVEPTASWVQDFPSASTSSSVVWGNTTAAFSATGPEKDVDRFMKAFPM